MNPLLHLGSYRRVNNLVQLLDPSAIKGNLSQLGAVDAGVGIEDRISKMAYDCIVGASARLEQFVSDLVSIENISSSCSKHLSDAGFAAGQPPGETNSQAHGSANPRRMQAALTVFDMSMAMVSGPTPPGTGVIAPATFATAGWTSPISVDPFL